MGRVSLLKKKYVPIVSLESYQKYLSPVGSLTELFSDNERPLIHSRTVERLFVYLSGAKDLSRRDNSFDAALGKSGIGLKTFTGNSLKSSSFQKIAEFSNAADRYAVETLSPQEIVEIISKKRNSRLLSNSIAYGLEMAESVYHCLVRLPGGVLIHERPMSLIDTGGLFAIEKTTGIRTTWPKKLTKNASLFFSDGKNRYSFHRGKSVLSMKFSLEEHFTSKILTIKPIPNIFEYLANFKWDKSLLFGDSSGLKLPISPGNLSPVPGQDYVVLPLYSANSGEVHLASGLNQWLASGRKRSFGEAYIPIPAIIHRIAPGFFPASNSPFPILLPDGRTLSVKVCQAGDKALMSNPNSELGIWLLSMIEGSTVSAKRRFDDKAPYEIGNLETIGMDSVLIEKIPSNPGWSLTMADVGSYELFLEDCALSKPW